MSDNIFPIFRGLTYPVTKTSVWKTIVQTPISQIKRMLSQSSYPTYKWKLDFEYLEDYGAQADDIHKLIGFYNKQGGAADEFLFADDTDNDVLQQTFGAGDGSTKVFRLCRNYGGYIEPVFGIVMTPKIYINGVETSAFTWNTHGLITFTNAPASAAVLKWSGSFYYRVHFLNDTQDFDNIFAGGWQAAELQLESLKE